MTNPLPADRRAFLAVGMATVVAVSVAAPAIATPSNPTAEWDAAMAEYLHAKERMGAIPGDEIVNVFIAAEVKILETRAPNLRALRCKAIKISEMSDDNVLEPRDINYLVDDIARLLGDA